MSDEEYTDNLLSLEQIDRDSPEIWGEQMPGLTEYISKNNTETLQPGWSSVLTAVDLQHIQRLGAMPAVSIVAELKGLHDQAYKLGIQEAKEMTRGKYLNVFGSNALRKGK